MLRLYLYWLFFRGWWISCFKEQLNFLHSSQSNLVLFWLLLRRINGLHVSSFSMVLSVLRLLHSLDLSHWGDSEILTLKRYLQYYGGVNSLILNSIFRCCTWRADPCILFYLFNLVFLKQVFKSVKSWCLNSLFSTTCFGWGIHIRCLICFLWFLLNFQNWLTKLLAIILLVII